MDISKLTCGEKPIEQYSMKNYVDELNKRCKDGNRYTIDC